MNTDLTDEIVAGFRDKDSKKERFRSLYEKYDFLTAYSKHTDLRVDDNPIGAIGRADEFETHGILQLNFLIDLGLKPEHKLLDIGCGVGRASRRFVPYLHPGNYTGTDISKKALRHAVQLSEKEGWADRKPTFVLGDGRLSAVKNSAFDYVFAHSVFTHLPSPIVCDVLKDLSEMDFGLFCFTYKKTEGKPGRTGLKQFCYSPAWFGGTAKAYGLVAETMETRWPAGQRTMKVWAE